MVSDKRRSPWRGSEADTGVTKESERAHLFSGDHVHAGGREMERITDRAFTDRDHCCRDMARTRWMRRVHTRLRGAGCNGRRTSCKGGCTDRGSHLPHHEQDWELDQVEGVTRERKEDRCHNI